MYRTSLILLDLIKVVVCLVAVYWIWQGPRVSRFATLASVAIVAVCFLLSAPHFSPSGLNDFRNVYYPAGQAVLEDPAALGPLVGIGKFVNLPIVAYLFVPIGLLSDYIASNLFTLLGIVAVVWTWKLLCDMADLRGGSQWALLVLFAGFGPIIYSFKEGNTSHMVLLALAAALNLLRNHRYGAAGLLLGASSLIKLPLLLFGVYFLLRRDWEAVFAFIAVWVAAGLLSLAVFGWELHRQWFELCVLGSSVNVVGAFNAQSIAAFLARLGHSPDILRDWAPYPPSVGARLVAAGFSVLLYGAALWTSSKGENSDDKGQRRDLEYCLVCRWPR